MFREPLSQFYVRLTASSQNAGAYPSGCQRDRSKSHQRLFKLGQLSVETQRKYNEVASQRKPLKLGENNERPQRKSKHLTCPERP